MKKEFVNYNQALKLKPLGFNEPCFGWFRSTLIPSNFTEYFLETEFGMNESPSDWVNSNFLDKACSAPTYSQVFRWFREKYTLYSIISTIMYTYPNLEFYFKIQGLNDGAMIDKFNTYEEAESACLDKLIEIVEQTERIEHGVYQ